MSTLKTGTIENNTGTGAPLFKNNAGTEIGQLAKVWINFDGKNVINIRDSFNVSTITDNGTGHYTVNFTNAMSNSNYACSTTGGNETGNGEGSWVATRDLDDNLTTSVRIVTYNNSGSFQDTTQVYLIVFGD